MAALDAALEDRRMTRRDLAAAAGVAPSTLSALCRARDPLGASPRTCQRIADALGVEVAEVFPTLPPHAVAPVPTEYAGDVACLTVDEVARVLACSRSTVYATLAAGHLPSVSIGARKVVPVEALREFVRAGGQQV